MRIPCPFCGERDVSEFHYLGSAVPRRPDPAAADAMALFVDYVYLRDNPAGSNEELWYHSFGCRSWLAVTRDTLTHRIDAARLAARAGGGE
jgi:methylglutamate dehydrogenase subunit B